MHVPPVLAEGLYLNGCRCRELVGSLQSREMRRCEIDIRGEGSQSDVVHVAAQPRIDPCNCPRCTVDPRLAREVERILASPNCQRRGSTGSVDMREAHPQVSVA